MFKQILATTAAAILFCGLASAQETASSAPVDFYEVVPQHEFTLNGFGGLGTLLYKVDGTRSDLFNWDTRAGLGYGGGLGYIWHFTPKWGFMTGADFAVYHGGISLPGQNVFTAYTLGNDLFIVGAYGYSETQKYMAVQVPVMFQFMAPMGRGANFFYAALGARLGFNVKSTWKSHYDELTCSFGPVGKVGEWSDARYSASAISKEGGYGTDAWNPNSSDFNAAGDLHNRLVNVMASGEVGFRWHLGNGWGLYTGIYADYGFLPLTKTENVGTSVFPTEATTSYKHDHSVINSQGVPGAEYRIPDDYQFEQVRFGPLKNAGGRVATLGAGLKIKLAFGKVRKPVVPVVPIIRERVKTDTVVKTVVVRDTVEKVVRDTVEVVKEVPQEIKQTMMELSNTLFDFDKFNLTDKARAGLDKVADWLKANPDLNVEISGHTDSYGSDEYNQTLSENRAKSVYEYFVSHGVKANRLSYKGYGKSQPIATNETDEGRQLNRRVELNILR